MSEELTQKLRHNGSWVKWDSSHQRHWAPLDEADRHSAAAEIERLTADNARLTAERDEWQHKWMALAQASLLVGTIRLGVDEQSAKPAASISEK